MILAFDSFIYTKLSTLPALSGVSVDYWHPNNFKTMPVLAYRTSQQTSDMDYQDNEANYTDCTVELDLYTLDGTDDTVYIQDIGVLMESLLFNMDVCTPLPDPDTKLRHRHLTYTRQGLSNDDLV